jgi:DNA-binding response OmpR family regulator
MTSLRAFTRPEITVTKRKKKYGLLLYKQETMASRDLSNLELTVQKTVPNCTLIKLEDADEGLKVLMLKPIEFVIIDPSLLNDVTLSVEYAFECKKRRKCPVLFFTYEENNLIETYRDKMSLYDEMDDYLTFPLDYNELQRRLQRIIHVESRSSKRFSIGEKVGVLKANVWKVYEGTLTDLSLAGFGLRIQQDFHFHRLEQVRIQIPLSPFGIFHKLYGEFLSLAGRVRRLSIDGRTLGCSFEHLTSLQQDCLVLILETYARLSEQKNGPKAANVKNTK